MVQSRLTLTALYNYDNTIFDGLTVPEGIDKQTVIDTILLDCLPFETLFSQPEFLKMSIRIWSDSCQTVWNHLYETMNYDYNPIWNKDGIVTETDVYGKKNRTDNYGADVTEVTSGARHSETLESTAGFNSSEMQNHTKTTADINRVIDTSDRKTRIDTHADDSYTDTHTRKETGNIGITTTQQMIQEEREIAEFNLIKYIAADFKNRFCVMVY